MDNYYEDLNLKNTRKTFILEKMNQVYFKFIKNISIKLQTHVNRLEVTKKKFQHYEGFRIYSDGSHNPGTRGTTTCLIMREDVVVGKVWDCDLYASSLAAELAAVLLGIEETPTGSNVQVYTDCSSIVDFYKKLSGLRPYNWRKRYKDSPVFPLLIRLNDLMSARTVEVNWVPRHHPLIRWCHKCCRNRIFHWNSIQVDKTICPSIFKNSQAA